MVPRAVIIGLSLLLLGGCALFVERPEYSVVDRHDAFELRRYEPMVVAETRVEGRFREVGNSAFSLLAGYIGGENRAQQDIAMTAPVDQVPADGERVGREGPVVQTPGADGDGVYAVRFIMPAEYTLEALPEPTDERVRLRRIEGRLMAALRYSGSWSESRYRAREDKLLRAVRAAGLEPVGAPVFARYNPPLTPSFLRRNEVLIEVERR